MTREKIKKMKEILLSPDYENVWDFFYENFISVPNFMEKSKPAKNEILKGALFEMAKDFFKKEKPSVIRLTIYYMKNLDFYHGHCLIEDRLSAFFYFPTLNKGLIMLNEPKSGKTDFFRFTAIKQTGKFKA